MSHDVVMDEAYWDGRYRESQRIWSGNPNAQLIAEVVELTPGTALDVGCGEGADAIWLAERGWKVTAVDISTVALERAKAHGRERGVDVAWEHADLTVAAPTGQFDLVSAHYVHVVDGYVQLHRRLAAAVAPGGTLLLVNHSPLEIGKVPNRPQVPELYYTAEQVAATLDSHEWDIDVAEARPRTVHDVQMYDEVFKARRR